MGGQALWAAARRRYGRRRGTHQEQRGEHEAGHVGPLARVLAEQVERGPRALARGAQRAQHARAQLVHVEGAARLGGRGAAQDVGLPRRDLGLRPAPRRLHGVQLGAALGAAAGALLEEAVVVVAVGRALGARVQRGLRLRDLGPAPAGEACGRNSVRAERREARGSVRGGGRSPLSGGRASSSSPFSRFLSFRM